MIPQPQIVTRYSSPRASESSAKKSQESKFPEFGWTYQDSELNAILRAGLQASDPQTRQTAEEVRELLLRNRCFEYLDLESERETC